MTVIVSGGRPKSVGVKAYPGPLSLPTISGPSAGVVPLLRGDMASAAYESIYRSQPIVFAVVNKLVYGGGRVPLIVLGEDDRGEYVRQPGTSLEALLRNPYPRGSQFSIKSHMWLSSLIYGHALMLKYRPAPGAAPTELWPVPWRNVQTISDERGVSLYAITIGTEAVAIGPEDVVHVSLPGGSPLESLRRTVALEDAAATWQGENLRNGVTPRGAFTTDARLNEQVIPRLRDELTKLYAGPENAGRAAILEGGLKWQQIGLSAADSELIEQRKFSRQEVTAAYDVPLLLVVPENASSFPAQIEARRALYDAIAARLVLIEDTINSQLVYGEPEWDSLIVKGDTTDFLRPDPEARARMHMLTQQASTTTINERRMMEGLPRIDDPVADTVFMPTNMVPVGAGLPIDLDADDAGTPAQGIADVVTDPQLDAASLLASALKDLPAPVVNITVPESAPRTKRVERDPETGEITAIVEE